MFVFAGEVDESVGNSFDVTAVDIEVFEEVACNLVVQLFLIMPTVPEVHAVDLPGDKFDKGLFRLFEFSLAGRHQVIPPLATT